MHTYIYVYEYIRVHIYIYMYIYIYISYILLRRAQMQCSYDSVTSCVMPQRNLHCHHQTKAGASCASVARQRRER